MRRRPDVPRVFSLKVDTGVIFTGGSKIAEHGGFNEDDVHTALLVSFANMEPSTVKSAVTNQQVAPTTPGTGMSPASRRRCEGSPRAPSASGEVSNSVSPF